MIRKTQSLKTPIPFTIVTKMGNFDFLTRDFSKNDSYSLSNENKEEFERDLKFIKKNLDLINEKIIKNELEYSSVFLISKHWVEIYYNYLEAKVQNDLFSFNNESYKDLNYFNQDVLEKEALAEKFYKYHDDFRGLNVILKEYLPEEKFQIIDLNVLNFIKNKFKGSIIRREVRKKNNQENYIDFSPLRIQIMKFSNMEYQKFVNPEIYPSLLSDFFEEKYLQIFSYMTVYDLLVEILKILNNESKVALIPDIVLLRLWKLNPHIDSNDLIDQIKAHFNENSGANREKLIKIQGICLDNKKELTFQELEIASNDRFILEIKDNSKNPWFFYERSEKSTSNKRNFLSFLGTFDETDEISIKEPKLIKIINATSEPSSSNHLNYSKKKPSPNNFTYLSKTMSNTNNSEASLEKKNGTSTSQNILRGLIGIQNLGETCFINVILQMFNNIQPIREFFLGSRHKEDSNYESQLSKVLENVLRNLWDGDSKSISPHNFYDALKEKMPLFANYQQHDAHEFFLNFIDKLYPDKPLTIANGENHKKQQYMNISIFKENFFGILRNTIICPDCESKSLRFDPFLSLSLPIPQENFTINSEDFYRTYYINDDIESNHRVICLNLPLNDKKLKTMTLASFKDYVKKEIKTMEKHDIILVACNEKIIWKMYEDEKEKIFEIYSQARKEKHTLSFIEINPEAGLSPGSFFVFLAFMFKENESQNEVFLSLPRFLLLNKTNGIMKVLESYVLNLLRKIFNDPMLSEKKIEGCFELKLRLFDLFGNINNIDICENCKKNPCSCKSFKSDDYYFERERQYENSNFKLFIKLVFLTRKFSGEQFENLLLMKKSIKYNEENEITLMDCLQEFTKIEVLNEENKWFCQKCNQTKQGINQLDIFSAPKYLIFQLKRFITQNLVKGKIQVKIKFPLGKLDLTKMVKSQCESGEIWKREDVGVNFQESMMKISKDQEDFEKTEEVSYELLGVVNHLGNSLEKGHYFANFKSEINGFWYKYDDRAVSQELDELVCSSEAYILIYRRK